MKSDSTFLFTAASVLAILLLSGMSAFACSCMAPPTVDIVYQQTRNIAIFTVESASDPSKSSEGWSESAKLKVERVFKGGLKPGEEFTFSNQGPCAVDFQSHAIGKKYLLYLSERPADGKVWWAAMCTRSGPLHATAADVLYLEKRKKVLGKTRLSGMVSQQVEEDGDPRDWYFRKLSGLVLRIRGQGKDFTLKTDESGAYEVYGLPPGKYEIRLPEIGGFSPNSFDGPLEPAIAQIAAGKHTQNNFYYDIHNSIAGTLVDAQGDPIGGVCLDLIPIGHTLPSYLRESACTDIGGRFLFSKILSGNYILAGNKDSKISPREPYPRFFYPNTLEESGATRFAMAPGVHFTDLTITAPSAEEIVTLKGVVRYGDGKPVVKAKIEFFSGISRREEIKDPLSYSSWAETDEIGAFRLRVRKGESGIAIASFMANKKESKNCPQVLKTIEKGGFAWDDIETEPVTVDGKGSDDLLKLSYPFAACSKE